MDAKDALTTFLHRALAERVDRYVEFATKPKTRKKFLEAIYHDLEGSLDRRAAIPALPPAALDLPAYLYAPPSDFGIPISSLREVAGSHDDSRLCYLLERWTAPGLLLIGDAAHPMSPVGGQGLNIALRDALVAANHLVPAFEAKRHPAGLDAACAAVQAERYPEVEEVERLQRIPPRFFFRGGPLVSIALWLASRILSTSFVRRRARPPAITRTFLHGATSVELRV